jgi:uncharacterized membrane protein YphA (DoxX/SURF4 family)
MMVELLLGGRWVLGLILLVAGGSKFHRDQTLRAEAVANYGLLPVALVEPIAIALPAFEVVLGLMLLAGVAVGPVAGLAAAMLVSFAGAVAWNVGHGRRFDCGCGSSDERSISWWLSARDTLLAGLAACVTLGPSGGLALWRGPGMPAASQAAVELLPVPMLAILLAFALRAVGRQPGLVRVASRSRAQVAA